MRLIAKFFLLFISVAIPVVIAACYGAPYAYSKTGRVVDSETKDGINGIEVACMLPFNEDCEDLVVELHE